MTKLDYEMRVIQSEIWTIANVQPQKWQNNQKSTYFSFPKEKKYEKEVWKEQGILSSIQATYAFAIQIVQRQAKREREREECVRVCLFVCVRDEERNVSVCFWEREREREKLEPGCLWG